MLRSPNVSRSSPVSVGAAPHAPAGLRREAHVAAAASCVRCFGPAAAGGCHRLEEAPGSGGAGARFPPAGSGRPEGAATGQAKVYINLKSDMATLSGKEVNMDACNAVQDRIEMIENVETEVTVKWRKMEDPAEISYAKPCLDRTETENIHTGSKSNDDFRTPRTALCTERDTTGYWLSEEETPFTHPSPNQSEEIQQKYNNPAALRKDYSHMSLWEPVVYNIEQGTETTQKEGKMQLQPQIIPTRPQENVESKRGGFLELLKSTLFPPLQRVLGGNI